MLVNSADLAEQSKREIGCSFRILDVETVCVPAIDCFMQTDWVGP